MAWTIFLIVGILGLLALFTVPQAFQFASQRGINSKQLQIPYTNENLTVPNITNSTGNFIFSDWLNRIPVNDIKNAIVSGLGGITNWLGEIAGVGLSFLLHLINPNISAPPWLGLVLVITVFLALIVVGWESFWGTMHGIFFWILLISVAVIVIAIVLTFLHLI